MKKILSFLSIVAFSMLAFIACNKERQAVTKVIDVSLKLNETYSYQIPGTGDADDAMQITKEAAHASSNTLDFKNNSSPSTFLYTPVKDYTGTDEVQISNIENHHGNSNQQYSGVGNCQGGHHHHDEGTTYIFRITIASVNHPG